LSLNFFLKTEKTILTTLFIKYMILISDFQRKLHFAADIKKIKINKIAFATLFVILLLFGKNNAYSTDNEILKLEGLVKNVTGCYDDKNGFLKFYAVGGTPSYIYTINNWQSSQSTGDFLNLDVGFYTLKVRDALNNEASIEVEITQPEDFKLIGQKTNVTGCFGDNNGAISLSGSGGTIPYEFSINNGVDFYASNSFSELYAGYYSIVAKDKNGCQKSFALNLSEPEQITISTIWTNNVTPCFADRNGTAEIIFSGGTGTHTFSIDGTTFQEMELFENLAAGSYTARVKDINNCSAEKNFTIFQPDKLFLDSVKTTNLSCYNSNNGKISIFAHGGILPLKYTIGNENYTTSSLFENLAAADYNVKVQDANGCFVLQQVSIFQEDELKFSEIHTHVSCNNLNDATITLYASGGAGTYRYSINSGANYQATNNFANLSAKNYQAIVQDKNGCSKSITILITEPSAIIINSILTENLVCNGDSTGKITINSEGGTGTLFYSITSGQEFQNQASFQNLKAGYYSILIQDENLCKQTGSATLKEPIFDVNYSKQDIKCFGEANGSVSFSVYGSFPPFQFSSNNGVNYQEVTAFIGLSKGIYNFVVKDLKNCKKLKIIEILEPNELLMNEEINSGCSNAQDVSIKFNTQGGKTPYRFSIDNGLHYQVESQFSNLTVGNYSLKILDANNCSKSKSTSILAPDVLKVAGVLENLRCFNDFSGKIELNVKGGTKPYYFSIDNGITFHEDSIFSQLKANNYPTIIKDKNNCQKALFLSLTEPQKLAFVSKEISNIDGCFGDKNGSIFVSATGGSGNKSYALNNSNNFQSSGLFENLQASEYLVTAKDTNNCKISTTVQIIQPNALKIDQITKKNVETCFNFSDGNLDIKAIGGTLPLLYSINNGENFQSIGYFANLKAGNYNLLIKDASSCNTDSLAVITQPSELTINFQKTDISCFAQQDGEIKLQAKGGVGTYEFSINNALNFSANNTFSFLEKGNYSILAKDGNNCRTTPVIVSITEPEKLIFSEIKKVDLNCDRINAGEILAKATGGTGVITYKLDNSMEQLEGIFKNLSPGVHALKAEDENKCVLYADIELIASGNMCIVIPTAFTPNEDGINDTWEVQHLELYPEAWVQIYDRNGNTITRYKSGEIGWNGNFNSKPMPMGAYWYRIKLTKDSEIIKGNISLIR